MIEFSVHLEMSEPVTREAVLNYTRKLIGDGVLNPTPEPVADEFPSCYSLLCFHAHLNYPIE